MRVIATILLILWSSTSLASTAGDPERGKSLTETCVACHNDDGNSSVSLWPKIAGQHEGYLYKQLLAFHEGESGPRYDPNMYAMLSGFNQQDLQDLSSYYASQKMSLGKASADLYELGQALYRGGDIQSRIPACIGCHEARGLGNEPANFPRLSGQNEEYTAQQLKQYRDGARETDPNEIMRDIASRMTDQQIEAVSNYVAGLY
ncbi:MAG: cytochrome c4 [Francisellaceae bacterium]|nr:cytochrome c4 [Francisellaceae bacterium]MBT6207774.1 cytochrome c4 [Francisellaceae bacterium]MBT6538908.1 cytochrome c4 [Francisellaceae bacterium]